MADVRHWLMKSEPSVFSIQDLQESPDQTTLWEGVRNYQARNFMRDDMKVGDLILYYHSRDQPIGVAGIAEVVKEAYPDPTQLDPSARYFDKRAKSDNPPWVVVDIKFVREFKAVIPLRRLKETPGLEAMKVVQRGMRLSIQPVAAEEFAIIVRMADAP